MKLRKAIGGYSFGFPEQFRLSFRDVLRKRASPHRGVSEVSAVRLRRAGERSGRKGVSINARRLDNRDYVRERRVRRWFEEAIITCYRMTLLNSGGYFAEASKWRGIENLFERARSREIDL